MKTNLYELVGQYDVLMEMLYDPDNDEDCLLDTIEAIEGEIEVKAQNYCRIVSMMDSNAKALDDEIKRLQAKKKTIENRSKWLKNRLFLAMKELGIPKIKTDLYTISIQKNGGVQPVVLTGEIPDNFKKIVYEDDMEKVREALKNGEELEFAHFGERVESLRIR